MAADENEESGDKTTIVTSDTFKGKLEAATKAPPCVVVLMGPSDAIGKQWQLTSSEAIIGRSMNNQIFIDDQSVSKTHAKLLITASDVAIMDLNSTNKTLVNNKVVPPLTPLKLKHNDQIKTGNVLFKFLAQGSIEAVTNEQTFERSNTDALTGVHSKAYLLVKGPEAFKRAKMLVEPLTIIVFDIDHFKKVNDTYGHAAGDFILQEIASAVKDRLVRSNDFFARYGGEEFVILLLETPLSRGVEIADRVRTTIEAKKFNYEGTEIPITISAGVSTRSSEISSWEELFQKADEALYTSKNSGRNRITAAEEG